MTYKKLLTNEPASNISGLNLLIHTDRFFKSGCRKKKIRFASKKGSYVNNEYVNSYEPNIVPYMPTNFSENKKQIWYHSDVTVLVSVCSGL